jgi:hypothetical protein
MNWESSIDKGTPRIIRIREQMTILWVGVPLGRALIDQEDQRTKASSVKYSDC